MLFLIATLGTHLGTAVPLTKPTKRRTATNFRLMSGFDSLNATFHSNWPFGPSYTVARDPARGNIFIGAGGGVIITDSGMVSKVGEIRTRGMVWSLHYSPSDTLLYIAAGVGGLEIWKVRDPSAPIRQAVIHAPGIFRYVYVSPKKRAYVAAGSHVHVFNVSNPSSPSLIGSYSMPTGSYALKLAKFEKRIYVAAGDSGIIILEDNPSGPTFIRRIYEGLYTHDVEIQNYSPNFKDKSLTIYALNRTSSGNYVISTYDLLSGGRSSGMTLVLPSGLEARDMAFGGGNLWIVTSQIDSALIRVRVKPEGMSFRKFPTTGSGYAVHTSDNFLFMSMADRGVARFRIITDNVTFVDSIPLDSIVYISYFAVLNKSAQKFLVTGSDDFILDRRCFNLTRSSLITSFLPMESGPFVPSLWGYTVSMGDMVVTGCGGDSLFSADLNSTSKLTSVNIGDTGSMVTLGLQRGFPGDTVYLYATDNSSNSTIVAGYYVDPLDGSLTLRSLHILDTLDVEASLMIFGNYAYNFYYKWGNFDDRTLKVYELPDFTQVDSLFYLPPSADTIGLCGYYGVEPTDLTISQHVATKGDYLFALIGCGSRTTKYGELLLVYFDISDPENVSIAGYEVVDADATLSSPQFALEIKDNRAYIFHLPDGASTFKLDIYDITDPKNMKRIYSSNVPIDHAHKLSLTYLISDTLYVGMDSVLKIFAVNSQNAPQLLNTYNTPGWAKDVEVSGDYAYVAENDAWGPDLLILDVSGSQPDLIGSIDVSGRAEGLDVVNDTVYLALGEDGIAIIDATDKTSPALVGTYDTPGYAYDVLCDCGYLFASGLLFVADGDSLIALDISDPTSPNFYEGYGVSISGGAQVYGLDIALNTAYLAVGNSASSHGIWIVDVSSTPFTFVGSYMDSWGTDAVDVKVDIGSNRAYLAYLDNGVDVIDVSDPSNPTLLTYWWPPIGSATGVDVDGGSGLLYYADFHYGFQAIDFTIPSFPQQVKRYSTPMGPDKIDFYNHRVYAASSSAGLQIYSVGVSTDYREDTSRENLRIVLTNGTLEVGGQGKIKLHLYNSSGRLLRRAAAETNLRVDVSNFPSGVYIYIVESQRSRRVGRFVLR
ncbi:MAG: T9SS type A sorting domain-containing protein [Thermotogae bacterium]|nr:T9SS type A sorting domain-containing protein [Thermotogota bacterium]